MSVKLYLRRLIIGFSLLIALAIVSPLVIIGVGAICGKYGGDGCGVAAFVFIILGVMPALFGILCVIAWAVFKRLRALEFSAGYILVACLLLAGCFQSILFAVPAAKAGHMGWEVIAPPLLSAMILAALCWVPEASERGVPEPALLNALIVVSVLLLLRLANAIFYPLWFFPGGLSLSLALRKLAYLGPLKLIPDTVFIVTFATLFLLTFKQWRDPHRRAAAL